MFIAVILPSRGLIYSKTADELLQNLQGYDYDIFFAHGLPIPSCFETPLTEALNAPQGYTHFWFVEDDMILPEDTLSTMFLMDAPVVVCDYPVSKAGQGTVFKNKEGQVLFAGTGCMLVKREVFSELSKPYFRSDIRWGATNHTDFIRFTAKYTPKAPAGYGLHDVNFGMKLWQADIPISVADPIGQRKLIKLGKTGTNEGAHEIEEWWKLKPDYLYKKLRKLTPQPLGILVPVLTKDGEMMVHPLKARKLVRSGVATKPKKQSVSIDYNGVQV